MTIERGATVRLENGQSPLMTVETVSSGLAGCVWFTRSGDGTWMGPFRGAFASEFLVVVPKAEVP